MSRHIDMGQLGECMWSPPTYLTGSTAPGAWRCEVVEKTSQEAQTQSEDFDA